MSDPTQPLHDGSAGAPPSIVAGKEKVRFAPPRGRARAGWRLWFNSVYFVVLSVWAVVGSWDRQRVLGIVAALVYLELMLATVRLATFSGAVVYEQAIANRIAAPLVELCNRAHCVVPSVVIRDDGIRAAAARRGRRGRASLVVSKTFVDRVDDRQLRAILAHEVIHVARNDFASLRRRAWATVLAVVAVCAVVGATAHGAVVFPVLVAIAFVTGLVVTTALSTLNRRLEWRADTDGAQLCDDAAGLASALALGHAFSAETRLRVFGPMPWRWVLSPLSWTPPTHPPIARRIARLEGTASAARPDR